MIKFSKEENALVKAMVNLALSKEEITVVRENVKWLENDITRLLDRRTSEERYQVQDMIFVILKSKVKLNTIVTNGVNTYTKLIHEYDYTPWLEWHLDNGYWVVD